MPLQWVLQVRPRKKKCSRSLRWARKLTSKAYIFALVGYSIGMCEWCTWLYCLNTYWYASFWTDFCCLLNTFIWIGNVWQFPYVIASNGGPDAVVAYVTCAVFIARPLFLYKLIIGQYMRLTFVRTWEAIRPRWLSFGRAQFLLLFIAQTYFFMVITYTLPYIAGSYQKPFPWTDGVTSKEYWTETILNQYDDLNNKPAGPGSIQWRLACILADNLLFCYIWR